MNELKLSELNDDVEISKEESNSVYTVAELKREIQKFGNEDHFIGQWFTVKRGRWKPDAKSMIDSYLDNESCNLYEDFYSVAMSEMPKGVIKNIQTLLDEVFENNSVCDYWTYENHVEIDIFPQV